MSSDRAFHLVVKSTNALFAAKSRQLATRLALPLVVGDTDEGQFFLAYEDAGLILGSLDKDMGNPIWVDFVAGANAHRRKFGGGKQQDIARAVGISKKANIRVLDATAGLGRDAFVLASLGCDVTLIEKNAVVHSLLNDGIERALHDPDAASVVQRMHLIQDDTLQFSPETIDVVYLDPMFPPSQKSAKVKKELRYLHHIVGYDGAGADALLDWAMQHALKRVVVKRPRLAPPLAGKKPTLTFEGKSGRFDVYVKTGF